MLMNACKLNNPTSSELADACSLDKYEIRDQIVLSTLWDRCKNQNKIALFFGVNHSAVNKRYKEYKLA